MFGKFSFCGDQVWDEVPEYLRQTGKSFLFKGNQLEMNSICTGFQRYYSEFNMKLFTEQFSNMEAK